MKGRLVEAGKAAAVAAVGSKIDSLSDGLRERSEAMRAGRTGGIGDAESSDEENIEEERYRREDRAPDSGRKRHRDEDDGHSDDDQDSRVPAPRRGGARGESDRPRAARQSRSGEEPSSQSRARHPSRHDSSGARSGGGTRQGRDGGRGRPRSSASRTGGDNE